VDAARGCGAGDSEAGRELLEGMALVQVGEGEQCLGAGVEDPPASPDGPAVGADEAGGVVQGAARQRQRGLVQQQSKLLGGKGRRVTLFYQALLPCPATELTQAERRTIDHILTLSRDTWAAYGLEGISFKVVAFRIPTSMM
jgi:hypothetical protein